MGNYHDYKIKEKIAHTITFMIFFCAFRQSYFELVDFVKMAGEPPNSLNQIHGSHVFA